MAEYSQKGQGRVVIISVPGQLNLDERVRGVTEAPEKISRHKNCPHH